jgi:hypothetical protein
MRLGSLLVPACLAAACNSAFGVDEISFDAWRPPPGTTSGGGDGGAAGGSGGSGGDAVTSTSSAGGMGGSGGSPPALVDRGLVVRYYIDEAASGQMPLQIEDAAPMPLPLPIIYEGNTFGYVEVDGQRGLRWELGNTSKVMASITGTKVQQMLEGGTAGTIEVVVDTDVVSNQHSRISHIASPGELGGRFTLAVPPGGQGVLFDFRPAQQQSTGEWDVPLRMAGRVVVHVVLDSSLADPTQRVQAFVDGQPLPAAAAPVFPIVPPTLGEMAAFGPGPALFVGNTFNGDTPVRGIVFYSALYAAALTPPELANNVALLLVDDDTPP